MVLAITLALTAARPASAGPPAAGAFTARVTGTTLVFVHCSFGFPCRGVDISVTGTYTLQRLVLLDGQLAAEGTVVGLRNLPVNSDPRYSASFTAPVSVSGDCAVLTLAFTATSVVAPNVERPLRFDPFTVDITAAAVAHPLCGLSHQLAGNHLTQARLDAALRRLGVPWLA